MEFSRIIGIIVLVAIVIILSVAAGLWRRKLKNEQTRRWERLMQSSQNSDK